MNQALKILCSGATGLVAGFATFNVAYFIYGRVSEGEEATVTSVGRAYGNALVFGAVIFVLVAVIMFRVLKNAK